MCGGCGLWMCYVQHTSAEATGPQHDWYPALVGMQVYTLVPQCTKKLPGMLVSTRVCLRTPWPGRLMPALIKRRPQCCDCVVPGLLCVGNSTWSENWRMHTCHCWTSGCTLQLRGLHCIKWPSPRACHAVWREILVAHHYAFIAVSVTWTFGNI